MPDLTPANKLNFAKALECMAADLKKPGPLTDAAKGRFLELLAGILEQFAPILIQLILDKLLDDSDTFPIALKLSLTKETSN